MRRGMLPAAAIATSMWLTAASTLAQDKTVEERLSQLKIRHATPHYAVAGSLSDAQLREYATSLEAMYREFERGFGEILKDEPAEEAKTSRESDRKAGTTPAKGRDSKATDKPRDVDDEGDSGGDLLKDERRYRVVILRTRAEYEELARILATTGETSRGMHVGRYRLLLILAEGTTDEVYSTLFHEASHQVLTGHVANPPTWLNEGLADYFGSARPARGGVQFTKPSRNAWRVVRDAIQARKALPLKRVLFASQPEFYSPVPVELNDWEGVTERTLFYAQSYSLIHMMLNDPKGRKHLIDYLVAMAKDPQGDREELTRKHFGSDFLKKLEPGWVKYIKSRPEN